MHNLSFQKSGERGKRGARTGTRREVKKGGKKRGKVNWGVIENGEFGGGNEGRCAGIQGEGERNLGRAQSHNFRMLVKRKVRGSRGKGKRNQRRITMVPD